VVLSLRGFRAIIKCRTPRRRPVEASHLDCWLSKGEEFMHCQRIFYNQYLGFLAIDFKSISALMGEGIGGHENFCSIVECVFDIGV
jgi:hypothetical protein